MKLKNNQIILFALFLLFICNKLISQSKTSNWFSGSLNKQDNELLIITNSSDIFQRISFGAGVGFGFDTKTSKKSSLNYGLEITTHNNLISIKNYNVSSSNTSISIPISFKYSIHLKSKNSIVIFNGINTMFQGNNVSGISIDDFILNTTKNKGVFPLYQGAIGYNWIRKGEHQVLLKYNYGFREASSYSIFRNEDLIYQLRSNNTYFEIEYRIIINKSL